MDTLNQPRLEAVAQDIESADTPNNSPANANDVQQVLANITQTLQLSFADDPQAAAAQLVGTLKQSSEHFNPKKLQALEKVIIDTLKTGANKENAPTMNYEAAAEALQLTPEQAKELQEIASPTLNKMANALPADTEFVVENLKSIVNSLQTLYADHENPAENIKEYLHKHKLTHFDEEKLRVLEAILTDALQYDIDSLTPQQLQELGETVNNIGFTKGELFKLMQAEGRLREQLSEMPKKISEYQNTIQELASNPMLYGYKANDEAVQVALNEVARKNNVSTELLRDLIDVEKSKSVDLPPEKKYQLLRQTVEHFEAEEERRLVEQFEMEKFTEVSDLIKKVDASAEQKEQWEKMTSLEIPKGSKVKIVYIYGGHGLNMDKEPDMIKNGFGAQEIDVELVTIDNTKHSKEDILATVKAESTDGDYDIIIPYFSMHGSTKSFYGLAEVGSADDTFLAINDYETPKPETATQQSNTPSAPAKQYDEPPEPDDGLAWRYGPAETQNTPQSKAQTLAKTYLENNEGILDIKAGTTIKIGRESFYCKDDISTGTDLIDIIQRHLDFADEKVEEFTMSDLAVLQEDIGATSDAEFMYIFDTCFSGSATDEVIGSLDKTKAVLAATSDTRVSWEMARAGQFTKAFCEALESGDNIGQAFVRADILVNQGRREKSGVSHKDGYWQDPKAMHKGKNGEIYDVSQKSSLDATKNLPA